ncbi:MAG: hypothetical protein OHK0046_31270 [Anaerolineae bacterium]
MNQNLRGITAVMIWVSLAWIAAVTLEQSLYMTETAIVAMLVIEMTSGVIATGLLVRSK